MRYNWIPYEESKGVNQSLPPKHRYVLLQLPFEVSYLNGKEHRQPSGMAVGYLANCADGPDYPYFVIPKIGMFGGNPTHWCDCLGDDFTSPFLDTPKDSEEFQQVDPLTRKPL